MQTILIPTDFSKNALIAVYFVVNKLGTEETKYVLLNVYDIPHGGTSGLFYLMDELRKQSEKDMEDFSEALKKRFPDQDMVLETKLAQGDFSDQTNIIASDIEADCIVMGTKGASGVKEVLIGSSTVSLMRNLKRPLYVVPENYQEKEIEEMIISYDGKGFPDSVVPPIRYFTDKHQLPLRILHVRIGDESPIQDWGDLKSFFNGIKLSFHESHGDNYEDGLKKGIEGEKGLLVMVRRKQTFWERFFNQSDSRKAVMHAQLPILVVPE
jgi:nucleotide-binding universal stress UspA family protein